MSAREHLGASGMLVLPNNPENLTGVVAARAQVRSVFAKPQPPAPLAPEEVLTLLAPCYAHLRLDPAPLVRAPAEHAAAHSYALYRGDRRGTCRAPDEAAHELVDCGTRDADAPKERVTACSVTRPVVVRRSAELLRQRYAGDAAELERCGADGRG